MIEEAETIKISELESVDEVTSDDLIPIVQDGDTKNVSVDTLFNTVITEDGPTYRRYIKFPNGIVICFGNNTFYTDLNAGSSAYSTVYLPFELSSQYYTCIATPSKIQSGSEAIIVTVGNKTKTEFVINVLNNSSQAYIHDYTVDWQVIGRWK